MSTVSPSTIEGITTALSDAATAMVQVTKSAADDISPAFLTKLNTLKNSGVSSRIVCLDDVAAQSYKDKLAAFPAVDENDIVTVGALTQQLLGVPCIPDHAGRGPRILDGNDMDVLVEDVKVTGLKPRRLREMLKFFFKSFCECADEDSRWIIAPDEQELLDALMRNLKARNAILSYEAPALACRGILATGHDPGFDVLLADDFGMFTLAQQRLVEALANTGLVVAGSNFGVACDAAPYPNPDGMERFATSHPGATQIVWESADDSGKLSTERYRDPSAEFTGIAESIEHSLQSGSDPSDILVCVPNDTWGKKIEAGLENRNIAVLRLPASDKIKGDPRKPERCAAIKTATFLRLMDDPEDIVALRTWMGLGDWLLCSDAFLELMDYSDEAGCTPLQAIKDIRRNGAEPFALFSKLATRLDELDAMTAAYQPDGDNDALFASHGMEPAAPAPLNQEKQAVIVAPYRRCHGRHVAHTYIAGCIDGFLPAHDAVDDRFTIDHRNQAMQRERALFDDMRSTGRKTVSLSCFEEDLLENTGILKMDASRVFIRDTVRMAKVKPSTFLSR